MSHILVISRYSHSHIDVNIKSMGYVYGLRKMHAIKIYYTTIQNGDLLQWTMVLNVETGSKELVRTLSYAIVCFLHPSR